MNAWVLAQPPPNNNPKSMTAQLDYLLYELRTSYSSTTTDLQKQTTVNDSVVSFMNNFERPDIRYAHLSNRLTYANSVYKAVQKDGGLTPSPDDPTATPVSSGCGAAASNATSSPDCATAKGSAKILCEAKKYDVVGYETAGGHAGGSAYHKACPTINTSQACELDCSGLISVAIYDAFGNSASWSTYSMVTDGANWKKVSLSQVQPGDVVQPNPDHVEIIDHVKGGTIYTFGAHTDVNRSQPTQVGPSSFPVTSSNVYLHYVGKGS